MNSGRSLELFFVDGHPDGLLTAEVFNWTGHVLQVPRTRLKPALDRKETAFTGVYLLLGENENGRLAYIGESEDIGTRIRDHASQKLWWETAILVTSSANALHKAHVKYLESRLVELALEAQQLPLENGNTPPKPSLSEAAISNMEAFLETLLIVLPAIRVDMFINKLRPTKQAEESRDTKSVMFEIISPKLGINASATLEQGEMVVHAGSKVREAWVGIGSWDSGYRALRDQLIDAKVIIRDGSETSFVQNYAFSSPSAAAAVVQGRAANGRLDWKKKNSNGTYADWEKEQLLHSLINK